MIEVLQPGLLTTIQDLGRRNTVDFGMPPSGAFDPFLAEVANHLVGNRPNDAVVEFALIGPTLQFENDCWIAIAASRCIYTVEESTVPEFTAFRVAGGAILRFQSMAGWFGYLAVQGGIEAERVLGSVSCYVAGKIGMPLQKGHQLKSGKDGEIHLRIGSESVVGSAAGVLNILPAVHTSLFSTSDLQDLTRHPFLLWPQSNRMGIHLRGAAIHSPTVRRSAPALPGAIQVLPSRQLLILGPEGPVTGGYPQAAILSRTAWTELACTPPGHTVRLEWTDIERARQMLRHRRRIFVTSDCWEKVE